MSEYGYIPEVAQSFGDNTGVFDPADINNLVKDNKWTQYGQLELIETKIASADSQIIFDDIKQDIYNVHFLTVTNFSPSVNQRTLAVRFFENGVEEAGSVYQFAQQYIGSNGAAAEQKSTGTTSLRTTNSVGDAVRRVGNGYSYFYNLGDSTKYSFQTYMNEVIDQTNVFYGIFGSGVLKQASVVDQIKLFVSSGTFDCTLSLYGIRYS